ncbi:MAG: hypothetical protein WA190_03210 [Usitatibacter sp.]
MSSQALKAQGLQVQIKEVPGERPHKVYTFPSGRTLTVGPNPIQERGNEAQLHADAILEVVEDAEAMLHVGRGAVDAAHWRELLERAKVVQHNVENFSGSLDKQEAELYLPPATNPVEVAEDAEIRAHARSLQGDERTKLLRRVAEDLRLAVAFARDPLKTPTFYETGMHRWREEVKKTKANAFSELARLRNGVDWVRNVAAAGHNLVRTTPMKR